MHTHNITKLLMVLLRTSLSMALTFCSTRLLGRSNPKEFCHFDGCFRKGVAASGEVMQVCFGDDFFFIEILIISVRIGNCHESTSLDADPYAAQTAIIATLQIIENNFREDNKHTLMDFVNFDGRSLDSTFVLVLLGTCIFWHMLIACVFWLENHMYSLVWVDCYHSSIASERKKRQK